ncbi:MULTISPECIES: VOC family protein [Polaromonas]|uniref:VOC family protein n=1 Tax=Polaromonas aquatica TaxID=332657 RepID=A0ABW1TX69_9BURK
MIEGIDAITYSTDKWDDSARFFADWGLKNLSQSDTLQEWETLNGARVNVRRTDDASLPPPMEAGPTLREVVWGVQNDAQLEALAKAMASAPGFADNRATTGTLQALDPHGLRIVFQKSIKREIDIAGVPSNTWGDVRRIDTPSPIYERAQPVEIGHVVLFTDKLDIAEAFYSGLGFTTSDRYPGRGVFMRCSVNGGHHDIFLLQLPNKASGLNHVAFTVRDLHEVFGGGMNMSRKGWKTQLGPGKHPISSAIFWYFENPCGGLIEYNADEDHLTENWQVREFEPSPTAFAEWAIDGGIDGNTRRQPKVEVGTGFLTEKRPSSK